MLHLPPLKILALALLFLESCAGSDPKQTTKSTEPNPVDSVQEPLQNSTCILGEKILLLETPGENGLKSPDRIVVLQQFSDSLSATQYMKQYARAKLLNTHTWYFASKTQAYLVYLHAVDAKNDPGLQTSSIYKIRPDNFYADQNASLAELQKLYAHYELKKWNDSLYLVSPKKVYSEARYFNRLLLLNREGRVKKGFTFNDHTLVSIIPFGKGYVAGFNALETYTWFPSSFTFQLVYLDQHLQAVWTKASPKKGIWNRVTKLEEQAGKLVVMAAVDEGCGMCYDYGWTYQVTYDANGKALDAKVIQYPAKYTVSEDSLRIFEIKNQQDATFVSHQPPDQKG